MEQLDNLLTVSGIVYGIIILVVLAAVGFMIWLDYRAKPASEKYIEELFDMYWSGEEVDRSYAWFRVIQHLHRFYPDPQKIRMAEARRQQARRVESRAMLVDRNGKLKDGHDNNRENLKDWDR